MMLAGLAEWAQPFVTRRAGGAGCVSYNLTFRGTRYVVLHSDGWRDGGGAGVSDTGWIGRAVQQSCCVLATTSEEELDASRATS